MKIKSILRNFCVLSGSIGFLSGVTSTAFSANSNDTLNLSEISKNTLVMAWNIDAINHFDPAQVLESVTSELLVNMCNSLVEYDQNDPTKIRPSMARSWNVSDDGKTIVFHLRDDLKFEDGRSATAHDLAWSMRRIIKLGLSYAQFLMNYGLTNDNIETSIQALDDTTLQLTLDQPYPVHLVLAVIGQSFASAILDRQILEANAVNGDMGNKYLATHSACVGPYKLVSWRPSDQVILQATQNYWGEAPKVQRILIRHVAESASQRLLLEKGDVDIARDLSAEDVLAIEAQGGVAKINRILRPQSIYLALNNKNKILSHEKVRLAFRYLVDYENLGQTVLKGVAVPRASYIPLGVPGALDEEEGMPFKLDLEKAKQLITEAGYPHGFKANFIIGTLPYMLTVAQSIQENARKIGIDLAIERMAQVQLLSRNRSGNYDVSIMGWNTTEPDAHPPSLRNVFNPDPTFTQKQKTYLAWRMGYYDEKANKMVMDALFEKDESKRLEQYRDLQRYMLKHGPATYLFQTYHTIGVGPAVKNWVWNSFNIYYDKLEKYEQSE
ncbi:ABC transporter substrate-binding protein [Bartonella sp. F02]|uniref:ABC transporter substrate-binding protein n=1 Tax=Bartonella sp. F02 TaxID=2967262 RepID=UPI0022A971D3|nr:ABC transporter substrate-binding protein [Bartonella sp. F02]MCZ2328740.1 ABC transporter substrate-binding protein [Bartonella sp. F02]